MGNSNLKCRKDLYCKDLADADYFKIVLFKMFNYAQLPLSPFLSTNEKRT